MPTSLKFRAGGPVGEGEVYISRPADRELFELLSSGEYAYIVGPTQLGKTSLALRTLERLCKEGHPNVPEGFRYAFVDLHGVGRSGERSAWLKTVIRRVAEELELPKPEWDPMDVATPADLWRRFLEHNLRDELPERVILCFDEIGFLAELSPEIREDFLGAIRAVHARRGPKKTPTFCFLGIANPDELIENPDNAPFNVAKPVVLNDFAEKQATRVFLESLPKGPHSKEAFRRIYYWTSGHPYMTQRLCEAVATYNSASFDDTPLPHSPGQMVDRLVKTLFLQGRFNEPAISTVEKRIKRLPDGVRLRALSLYRDLLEKKDHEAIADSAEQRVLRLAGIVVLNDEDGHQKVKIRNRIFEQVFNHEWVDERILEMDRPGRLELSNWLKSGKSQGDLLRGDRLQQVLQDFNGLDPTREEAEFLSMSGQLELQEQRAERRSQRTYLAAAGAIVLVLLFLVIFTQYQKQEQAKIVDTTTSALASQVDSLKATVARYDEDKRTIKKLLDDSMREPQNCVANLGPMGKRFASIDEAVSQMSRATDDLQRSKDELNAKVKNATLAAESNKERCEERVLNVVKEQEELCNSRVAGAWVSCKQKIQAECSASIEKLKTENKEAFEKAKSDKEKEQQTSCLARLCAREREWDTGKSPERLKECPATSAVPQ